MSVKTTINGVVFKPFFFFVSFLDRFHTSLTATQYYIALLRRVGGLHGCKLTFNSVKEEIKRIKGMYAMKTPTKKFPSVTFDVKEKLELILSLMESNQPGWSHEKNKELKLIVKVRIIG